MGTDSVRHSPGLPLTCARVRVFASSHPYSAERSARTRTSPAGDCCVAAPLAGQNVEEDELQELYQWVDEIPLSRPKRNIARDFADGVLVAEIVAHYFPRVVELHNYSSANSLTQKMYNWNTLNARVFRKLGFTVSKPDCEEVTSAQPGAIERVLKLVRHKLARHLPGGRLGSAQQGGIVAGMAGMGVHDNGQRGAGDGRMHVGDPHAHAHGGMHAGNAAAAAAAAAEVSRELLADKEATIQELRETNEILETKVRKLEQLVRLKDAKIQVRGAPACSKVQPRVDAVPPRTAAADTRAHALVSSDALGPGRQDATSGLLILHQYHTLTPRMTPQ